MAEPFFKVSVRIPKAWKEAPGNIARIIREANRLAAEETIRIYKRNVRAKGAIGATRELVNAAKSRVMRESGVRAWYTRGIFIEGPALEYIDFVDKRRNAGRMPIEVWEEDGRFRWRPFPHVAQYLQFKGVPFERWWVAIKGMARGFKGHHFIAATVREARPVTRQMLNEAVENFKKQLTSKRGGRRGTGK